MPDSLQPLLKDVSIDAPWELIERFATFPRWKPEDVNAGCDMLVERLRRHGVKVTVHEPELHLSIPYEASVSANGTTYRGKPPAYTKSTPDGLTAPLAYVAGAYAKGVGTFFHRNVDPGAITRERLGGKIVISEGFGTPGRIREFEEVGALGVISVQPGIDIHWGISTSIWGTPDLDDLPRKPRIPVVAVNNPDGKALIALAQSGGSATLRARLEEGWWKQKLPVVDIPGKSEKEKFVLIHGHYDSWDVGVGDNATGNATLLELARVLWKRRGTLRRSIRIAWWPGHSTGRYAGSTWFADHFAQDLDRNCVLQMNCDSPGCRWATIYKDVSWMSETEGFAKSVIREAVKQDAQGDRPHRAGDYAFNNIGLSSMFMLSSTMPEELRQQKGYYAVGGCGGNIAWHTENDTLEIADRAIMLKDIRVYLTAAVRAADAEVLPLDWRATAREFAATVDKYQKAAGDRFDLTPSRRAVASLSRKLGAFYAAVKAKRVKPKAANEVIAGLARILVPINFTRGPRFRHDPAMPIPALPTISLAAELDAHGPATLGFARTQLVRGQNRLVAALREAEEKIASAMK
jgi:hypothetical protein